MSHLKNLVAELSGLSLSAEYWDVRVEDTFETNIVVVNGEMVTCNATPSLGAFVRLRKKGFWLFEATTEIGSLKDILERLDKQTVSSGEHQLFPVEKLEAYENLAATTRKFSAVPMAEKIELAKKYESFTRSLPNVVSTRFRYADTYKVKAFLNSAGTQYEYDFNQGGWYSGYTLKDGKELFEDATRMYASRFEDLKEQDNEILEHVKEAIRFLSAPAIAPGKYKVLLDPEVTGVFTHESFGHKSEADFMLGNAEAMVDWSLGKKIGADCLTIVDHGNIPNSSGYCPIDDDGTPAQKNYLIKNGVLTGRLHSRETAFRLYEKPTGNSRALNFEFEPIVRMTSTYIEPGEESFESILQRSEGALLVRGVKHGSGLSTFTIAPTRGYKILAGGELVPVRLTVISGSVFETLKNIEAVSQEFHLYSSTIGGCGKMDQWPLPVSDGGPYVLVKEMQVN